MEKKKCCICGALIVGYGNDPVGAMWLDENDKPRRPSWKSTDRCCEKCNMKYVVTGRLFQIYHKKKSMQNILNRKPSEKDEGNQND